MLDNCLNPYHWLNVTDLMYTLIKKSYKSRPKAHFPCNLTNLMIAFILYVAHGIQILANRRIDKKMLSSWDFIICTFNRAWETSKNMSYSLFKFKILNHLWQVCWLHMCCQYFLFFIHRLMINNLEHNPKKKR